MQSKASLSVGHAPNLDTPEARAAIFPKNSPSGVSLGAKLKKITSQETFVRQGDSIVKFTNKREPLARMEAARNLICHVKRLEEIKENRRTGPAKQFQRAGEGIDLQRQIQ